MDFLRFMNGSSLKIMFFWDFCWSSWIADPRHVVTVHVMGVLVVASFWQVRTSHAMLLILNWWSANLLTGQVGTKKNDTSDTWIYIYIHTYVCNVMQCNVIWTGTWHLQVSCMEAKREWRGVSGLFRKTSRTFEHCFAALASLIVMLALCALYDLRQGLRVRNRTEEVGLKQPKIQLIQLAFFLVSW